MTSIVPYFFLPNSLFKPSTISYEEFSSISEHFPLMYYFLLRIISKQYFVTAGHRNHKKVFILSSVSNCDELLVSFLVPRNKMMPHATNSLPQLQLFPFGIIIDSKLKVKAAGGRIRQLLGPNLIGSRFIDYFRIQRPVMQFSWNEVLTLASTLLSGALKNRNRQSWSKNVNYLFV